MPLLRRQPFHREKPPPDLHPDEEVFFCKLTREVFRDYEKFFERIILCNSLVWSCAITGRASLTYQEAEESEEKALKQLASFPTNLQKPILYLASKTQRSRLADLNDDVFVYAKDRFFIGETIDCITGQSKKACKVIRVLPPGSSTPKSPGSAKSPVLSPQLNGDIALEPGTSQEMGSPVKKGNGKAEAYQYTVQEQGKSIVHTVKFKMLSRKKGLLTRDKCKLFLKQNCFIEDGIWKVKTAKVKKMKLNSMLFDEIFAGQPPQFEVSEIKVKKAQPKKPEKEISPGPAKKQVQDVPGTSKQLQGKILTPEEIKVLKEQERVQREKEREERLALKMKEREEIRRKFEEEKERKRKEKAEEVEKKREERRIQTELWREWSKHRDDMDCDDLKCKVPDEQFGDAIMVVEFINCFSSIFDLKASFPKGFTIEILFDALLETDAGGLMADLLLMMLTAIFSLQEEEEEEEAELKKQGAEQDAEPEMKVGDMSLNQLIDAATSMAKVPQLTQGTSLRKLPLDNFTLTEILRLHILASGAQGSMANAKFRYQQRGGYMPIDDAGLDFKRREPDIVSKLAIENIYDFTPAEKLKLLNTLVDQFLTYAATRDLMDDNSEKLRQLRLDLRQLQWGEQKREREEAANRYRGRMEEKQKEKDIQEKQKLIRFKKREQILRKEEGIKNNQDMSNEVAKIGEEIETLEKDLAELEASLPSQEERDQARQEEDDAESDKKAECMSREREFVQNIMDLQHGFSVQPLGRDRMYRRYWAFKSIPGIFVEDDEQFVSPEALKPCVQNPNGSQYDINDPFAPLPKLPAAVVNQDKTEKPAEIKPQAENKDGSDKENDSLNASNLNVSAVDGNVSVNVQQAENRPAENSGNDNVVKEPKVNGDAIVISDDDDSKTPSISECFESEAIKQINKPTKWKWAFYSTEEDIEALIASLNLRGFREHALKQALVEQKSRALETVSKVPEDLLYIPKVEEESESGQKSDSKVTTTEVKMKGKSVTYTAQNDSAHEGLELNLREMILDLEERIHVGSLGYLRVSDRSTWREALESGDNEKVKQAKHAKQKAEAAKKEQKKARKDDDSDDDSEEVFMKGTSQKQLLERWEDSCLASTSLAQVFLHLSTLDKSVIWSKSLLHTRCRICRKKSDPDKILLCDQCDRGHHLYCLKPALKQVPVNEWFCPDCRPKEVKSPRKGRRRAFSQEESSEEEEEEESVEEEDEAEDEASEEEENEVECAVCGKSGTLVCCDSCPLSYHLTCANPALKKVPKGKWLCQICTGTDAKSGKIKMNLGKGKKKSSPKLTPSSSKASSRRGSPRDSPVTVGGGNKKRKRDESPLVEQRSKLKKSTKSTSKLTVDNSADVKHYVSSSRGSTQVQQLKLLEDVVLGMMEEEEAWPFMRPVNKRDAPDYYEVIKKPMDFQTIKNKIKKFSYGDPADLVSDVRQIFTNCTEYNKRTTQEFKAGANMSKLFERRMKNLEESAAHNGPTTGKRARTK
ncbi:BAZ1A-like protein [Mya arenaria]|uniref:BAZ1A-like protein n=1 Tax=Mya arenaria TaxID=6604 RepID=A0ABY7F805_MYAAR|nr:BAZ1A-like protein [Mya arenaria]